MSAEVSQITSRNGRLTAGMTREDLQAKINQMGISESDRAAKKLTEAFESADGSVDGLKDGVISEEEIKAYDKKQTWKKVAIAGSVISVIGSVILTGISLVMLRRARTVQKPMTSLRDIFSPYVGQTEINMDKFFAKLPEMEKPYKMNQRTFEELRVACNNSETLRTHFLSNTDKYREHIDFSEISKNKSLLENWRDPALENSFKQFMAGQPGSGNTSFTDALTKSLGEDTLSKIMDKSKIRDKFQELSKIIKKS